MIDEETLIRSVKPLKLTKYASGCSIFAVIACLFGLPFIYFEIEQLKIQLDGESTDYKVCFVETSISTHIIQD